MKSSRAGKIGLKKSLSLGTKVTVKISKNLVSFKKCFVNVPNIAGSQTGQEGEVVLVHSFHSIVVV